MSSGQKRFFFPSSFWRDWGYFCRGVSRDGSASLIKGVTGQHPNEQKRIISQAPQCFNYRPKSSSFSIIINIASNVLISLLPGCPPQHLLTCPETSANMSFITMLIEKFSFGTGHPLMLVQYHAAYKVFGGKARMLIT